MFSVVVPTFNRGPLLRRTLDSLLAQRAEVPCEIIVVDNNSTDDTLEVIRDYERRAGGTLRYVREREQGSSAARNAGLAMARGHHIAFVDDDVIAHPGWLQALRSAYQAHPDAWCVGGRVILHLPEDLPAWFDADGGIMPTYLSLQDLGSDTRPLSEPTALISANLSIARSVLPRVGLFDQTLGRFGTQLLCGEDVELCRRVRQAGGTVYYCGAAVVAHLVPRHRLTKRFFRERAYWQGRTDVLLSRARNGAGRRARLGAESLTMLKDAGKVLVYASLGDPRRAFQHELAIRKRLGYVHQLLVRR